MLWGYRLSTKHENSRLNSVRVYLLWGYFGAWVVIWSCGFFAQSVSQLLQLAVGHAISETVQLWMRSALAGSLGVILVRGNLPSRLKTLVFIALILAAVPDSVNIWLGTGDPLKSLIGLVAISLKFPALVWLIAGYLWPTVMAQIGHSEETRNDV